MVGELKPKRPSIFKRPLTRKSKPEEPFVLNQLQGLPDSRTSHAISRNPKLVGESAPLLIGTIGPASAAGAMGVTSGLFNFIAAWIANTSIQSMISPMPYDRLVMKLDKHASQIMQARLKVLIDYGPLVERMQGKRWQGSSTHPIVGQLTVDEVKVHAVNIYERVMNGDERFSDVVQSLENFINEGGRKKSTKELCDALQNRIRVACILYHLTEYWAGSMDLWETKYKYDVLGKDAW